MNSRFERPSITLKKVVVTGVGVVFPLEIISRTAGLPLFAVNLALPRSQGSTRQIFDATFAGEIEGLIPIFILRKKSKEDGQIHSLRDRRFKNGGRDGSTSLVTQ